MSHEHLHRSSIEHSSLPVAYSLEIEFLVAQELPGIHYQYASDGTDDSLVQQPWVCPAEEPDPYAAILDECKELLIKNDQSVAICEDPSARETSTVYFFNDVGSHPDDTKCWTVEPSVTTYAKRHSPQTYEWFGVRLGSPPFPESELKDEDSAVKWVLGALRLGLLIHVNSTCRFNVHIKPLRAPFSLLSSKKLTTLVWVLEKELLERVAPNSYGLPFPHVRTLETCSRISSLVWHGSGGRCRPEDPLRAAIMEHHLPNLHNKDLLARLRFVWETSSLAELANGLTGTNGEPASFAIRPAESPSDSPTFEFRYALWHPYSQLDASSYWIELSMRLLKATARSADKFKQYISQIDHLVEGFSANNMAPADRWKTLLSTLGLSEEWSTPWEMIIDQYKNGRQLATRLIDKQSFLGQIDELKIYERKM
ncbi:hypothetical protein Trco_008327 [Trichoderma cornu-damae]|uniref:Uncharacterized protein n=1 Tax=Trichoderma cornu-damae TaxID=654480 RepID=A0A9P8QJM2_9HYPO|nr:hypothetical protein Trco_008327 [Trichoderma cornu-damae]